MGSVSQFSTCRSKTQCAHVVRTVLCWYKSQRGGEVGAKAHVTRHKSAANPSAKSASGKCFNAKVCYIV